MTRFSTPLPRFVGYTLVLASLFPQATHAKALLQDPPALRREAASLFREGHYGESIQIYQDLVNLEPKNVTALKDLMWAQWNSGRYAEGEAVAREVLRLLPGDIESRRLLERAPQVINRKLVNDIRAEAIALYRKGDYVETVKRYKRLTELEPENTKNYKDLLWAQYYSGAIAEAKTTADTLLRLRPGDSDAMEYYSRLNRIKTRDEKVSLYDTAIASEREGRYEEAQTQFDQLLARDPNNVFYLSHVVSILNKREDYLRGLQVATRLTQLHPSNPKNWNWLSTMNVGLNRDDAAMDASLRSLALDPDQPRTLINLGKLHMKLREFKYAITMFERAKKLQPGFSDLYPLLAKSYYWSGDFDHSLEAWAVAVDRFPTKLEYQFSYAQTMYYASQRDKAKQKLAGLAEDGYGPALEFLIDDALAHGDTDAASSWLNRSIRGGRAPLSQTSRLIELDLHSGRFGEAQSLIDEQLSKNPRLQPALMARGQLYENQKMWVEGARAFRELLAINPYTVNAYMHLAYCEKQQGRKAEALAALEKLRAWNPTYPYYLLTQAEYLYEFGEQDKARALLTQWLNNPANDRALPILLYHGLTAHAHDTMLAYPYHMRTAVFENQMRALAQAGYQPVSTADILEWRAGRKPLPLKPVFITFDDNRADSFEQADLILANNNLKATMFVALVNLENPFSAGYASQRHIRQYLDTGRWDVQSHGDIAHIRIPMSDRQDTGLFLINRQWLSMSKRLETETEWIQRVDTDHENSIAKIRRYFDRTPKSYAYPEGVYGQDSASNSPNAAPVNQERVRKQFEMAYTQDSYGFVSRSQDPAFLTRLIPENTWTGKQLLSHLRQRSPRQMMMGRLASWAELEKRPAERLTWIQKMHLEEPDETALMIQEARAQVQMGNPGEARTLLEQARTLDPTLPAIQSLLEDSDLQVGWEWNPSARYESDSSHRRNWVVEQSLSTPRIGRIEPQLLQRWGRYTEDGVTSVIENALGLGLGWQLGKGQRLNVQVLGHLMSDAGHDDVTENLRWSSLWSPQLKTSLLLSRNYVYTPRALNASIMSRTADAQANYGEDLLWRFRGRARFSDLTDDNQRAMGLVEAARLFYVPIRLRGVVRLTYDDMKHDRPEYYSPNHLRLIGFGPEFVAPLPWRSKLFVQYLPGYAAEEGADDQWVHQVEARWSFQLRDNILLTPSYLYYGTPTYHGSYYQLELGVRF